MNTIRILIRIATLFFASLGVSVVLGPVVDKPLTKLIDWIHGLLWSKGK